MSPANGARYPRRRWRQIYPSSSIQSSPSSVHSPIVESILVCHGRAYRLSIGGIGLGSLGVAAADLAGTASNVHNPANVAGTYGAAGAGVTFVGGGQGATLQNQNGVVLRLSGGQVGFQVSLGLAGMTIAMR